MSKAIILLSGGIDSATALWYISDKQEVDALSFRFHERNRNEMKAARILARKAGVNRHIVLDVGFLKDLSEIPDLEKDSRLEKLRMPLTYIPSRNTIFFGIASHFAEIIGAKYIVTGHSQIDPFPDSKPRYVKAINAALSYGSWLGKKYRTRILMPFAKMDKINILRLALKLGIPLESTWSCHKDDNIACGKCSGCTARLGALRTLQVEDKIRYN